MVARWDPAKDHQSLVAALAKLPRGEKQLWQCVLVGPGMDEANSEVVGWLAHYGLTGSVRLCGATPNVPSVMSALDLHVLSSIVEGFPNVVAEAMACETPCVVTDVGDAALIVGDTGWVVAPGAPDALASGLSRALDAMTDRVAWRGRQQAARHRIASKFSVEAMVRSYGEVWQDAHAV